MISEDQNVDRHQSTIFRSSKNHLTPLATTGAGNAHAVGSSTNGSITATGTNALYDLLVFERWIFTCEPWFKC